MRKHFNALKKFTVTFLIMFILLSGTNLSEIFSFSNTVSTPSIYSIYDEENGI